MDAGANKRAVFAGCARNCEEFLEGTLSNLAHFAETYSDAYFIFVENDSTDGTKSFLSSWLANGRNGVLIELDGLAKKKTARVDRITHTRNAYLEAIRETSVRDFDHLIVADLDCVNAAPIDAQGFRSAIAFLDSSPSAAGVFANAAPVYYDIWALRHPIWSPNDCLKAVRKRGWFESKSEAYARNVLARQVSIPPEDPPIQVESAFGGLGVYKMLFALTGSYSSVDADGGPVCEHVSFNEQIRKAGGELYIVPAFQNHTHV